jgi:hypothetical protein
VSRDPGDAGLVASTIANACRAVAIAPDFRTSDAFVEQRVPDACATLTADDVRSRPGSRPRHRFLRQTELGACSDRGAAPIEPPHSVYPPPFDGAGLLADGRRRASARGADFAARVLRSVTIAITKVVAAARLLIKTLLNSVAHV